MGCLPPDQIGRVDTRYPSIVITAKAQDIDKILGLRIAKVEDYISKPFNPQDLVERVEQVLFRGKDTVHQGN
jgi:DNA-binding response OmpR family regulator